MLCYSVMTPASPTSPNYSIHSFIPIRRFRRQPPRPLGPRAIGVAPPCCRRRAALRFAGCGLAATALHAGSAHAATAHRVEAHSLRCAPAPPFELREPRHPLECREPQPLVRCWLGILRGSRRSDRPRGSARACARRGGCAALQARRLGGIRAVPRAQTPRRGASWRVGARRSARQPDVR